MDETGKNRLIGPEPRPLRGFIGNSADKPAPNLYAVGLEGETGKLPPEILETIEAEGYNEVAIIKLIADLSTSELIENQVMAARLTGSINALIDRINTLENKLNNRPKS